MIETRPESQRRAKRVKVMLLIPFTCFPQDKSKTLLYRWKIFCSTELFQHYNNVDTAQLLATDPDYGRGISMRQASSWQ
jgi:hypothetical protein